MSGSLTDNFLIAAAIPVDTWHVNGTLEEAERLLAENPQLPKKNIYCAAVLGDVEMIRECISHDPSSAVTKGGPHQWDPLTWLCFSRFLRSADGGKEHFADAARLLLQAGADPNTGWFEKDHSPDPEWESVLYGASGLAHHPGLTKLLLDHGADPNDNEVPYHSPETYDNRCMQLLLDSGRMSNEHIIMMLIRKHDWHDYDGARMILATGIDPNLRWGNRIPMIHSIQRDNRPEMIQLLLDHKADPTQTVHGISPALIAACRGRGDLLSIFESRGFPVDLTGVYGLIADCARNRKDTIRQRIADTPALLNELRFQGANLLAEFSGNNNVDGINCLLDLGIPVDAPYRGDGYFGIPPNSTALHVASWRAAHDAVERLIALGAAVDLTDGNGQTPLQLAVRACVDSYWKNRRSTRSINALITAGANTSGVAIPTGYDEADELLKNCKP